MNPVTVSAGTGPVVLAFPHTGTWLPVDVQGKLNLLGQELADTDWHVDRLYDGLLPTATTLRANFHRYVIDANRDPAGGSLYPGQNTTGLVPFSTFDGEPIWREEPDAAEIAQRTAQWHALYHAELAEQLERVRSEHGAAILFDCHSIRSAIPFLFDGVLPDLNLGTNSGQSCAQALQHCATRHCAAAAGYTHVVNGRFKGGWTTRHYGQPQTGVHAVQLELAQRTYLSAEAAPFEYDPAKANRLRAILGPLLAELEHIALSGDLA